jgi:hypothetical protein
MSYQAIIQDTYTPEIEYSGGQSGITYALQSGIYCKIGPLVFVRGSLAVSNKGTSTGGASAEVRVTLPFTSNDLYYVPFTNWEDINFSVNYTYLGGANNNTNYLSLIQSGTGVGDGAILYSQLGTSFDIFFQGYFGTDA